MDERRSDSERREITTSCYYDCGSRCLLRVQVEDGKIRSIGTDKRPMPSLKACAKGLTQKDVVYSPDRLTRPLKRTGPRGTGQFAPIDWDEALDTVASKLQSVKERYGHESVFLMDHFGSMSPLYGVMKATRRFFAMFGGCTTWRGNLSQQAAVFSSTHTFGTVFTGDTRDNYLHSKLIIIWGWNPLATRFGPDTGYYLSQAKKSGTRIVCIDPRRSLTAKILADRWIPIRPGADAAMLIAMAHAVIDKGLADNDFIEKYTYGFEAYRDYVMGDSDGTPKTPKWAEEITGVDAGVIEELACAYATQRPAALRASWAPGRTAFGEQYHRAAAALAAITGNIGVPGGHASGGSGKLPFGILTQTLPVPESPVFPTIHFSDLYDAMLTGKSGGFACDIKMMYIVGCNLINQWPNVNKGTSALKEPEFIVLHELFMTPTAKFADIILPVNTALERTDAGQPWTGGPYFIHMKKAVDPLPETKSDLEIFTELADRLGFEGFNDKTDEQWIESFVNATPDLPDYQTFKKKGVHEIPVKRPWVAFADQIRDPAAHPFPTPSGKIEIYSRTLAELDNPLIPPIPTYIEPWEGPRDAKKDRYPIQIVSPHSKFRVNSQFDNIPRLKAMAKDALWINTEDARVRGIADGDPVRVYNDRGSLRTTAAVTDRIMPGVANLDEGVWFTPDENGEDTRGCVNVLTADRRSPGGALPCNTCLVQIEKI